MRLLLLTLLCLTIAWSEESVPGEAYINIYQPEFNEAGNIIKQTWKFSAHLGEKMRYWKIEGKPLDYAVAGAEARDIKLRLMKLSGPIVNDAYKPDGKYYYINTGFSNASGSMSSSFFCGKEDGKFPDEISEIISAIKKMAGDAP